MDPEETGYLVAKLLNELSRDVIFPQISEFLIHSRSIVKKILIGILRQSHSVVVFIL